MRAPTPASKSTSKQRKETLTLCDFGLEKGQCVHRQMTLRVLVDELEKLEEFVDYLGRVDQVETHLLGLVCVKAHFNHH